MLKGSFWSALHCKGRVQEQYLAQTHFNISYLQHISSQVGNVATKESAVHQAWKCNGWPLALFGSFIWAGKAELLSLVLHYNYQQYNSWSPEALTPASPPPHLLNSSSFVAHYSRGGESRTNLLVTWCQGIVLALQLCCYFTSTKLCY